MVRYRLGQRLTMQLKLLKKNEKYEIMAFSTKKIEGGRNRA
jgi:hypothetical protein